MYIYGKTKANLVLKREKKGSMVLYISYEDGVLFLFHSILLLVVAAAVAVAV